VKAVKEILAAEGTSVEEMDLNESYSYDGGDAYYDLTIEKVYEDVLSVEQHYTQMMDRMSAPEIRFDVSDPDDWTPIEYTNHDSYEVDDKGRKTQVYRRDETGLEGVDELIETLDKNLKQQFPAEEVAGGDDQ
jgi:hypothetical protein